MKRSSFLSACACLWLLYTTAGIASDKKDKYPQFVIETEVQRTPVKNQAQTGTCWCFSTISFLESEILRNKGPEVDLSEMYVVRRTYPLKADSYIRLHGNASFSQGGQSHDVFNQIERTGIVPEDVYSGMRIGEKKHNHGEMVAALKGLLDGILHRDGNRISDRWKEAFEDVLNVYLGTPPETFEHRGKTYTPIAFAQMLGIRPREYVELMSDSRLPFHQKARLEVPDNWSFDSNYINVPIDELESLTDGALRKGYSLVWDGDVSERDFSSRKTGFAIVPKVDYEDLTEAERQKEITEPVPEKEIDQETRQNSFNDQTTTDDHLMHIVGIAHDRNGTKFYLIKNSGGTDRKNEGYVYMSRSYFRLKTLAITVHKDALPQNLKTVFEGK